MGLNNESEIYKKCETLTCESNKDVCNDWFATYVPAGKEEKIRAFIDLKFSNCINAYLPKRIIRERKNGIWRKRIRLLFPGYLFLNGHIEAKEYYELKKIPGLWKIFKYGNDLLPLPKHEVDILLFLINQGKPIEESYMLKTEKEIIVVDGPLLGMEGKIIRIDHRKGRAKVKLTFLGEERVIDFGVEFLANTN